MITKDIYIKSVGKVFKRARIRSGRTRRQLCNITKKIDEKELFKVEKGLKSPSCRQVYELVSILSNQITDEEKMFFSCSPIMFSKILSRNFQITYFGKELFSGENNRIDY